MTVQEEEHKDSKDQKLAVTYIMHAVAHCMKEDISTENILSALMSCLIIGAKEFRQETKDYQKFLTVSLKWAMASYDDEGK